MLVAPGLHERSHILLSHSYGSPPSRIAVKPTTTTTIWWKGVLWMWCYQSYPDQCDKVHARSHTLPNTQAMEGSPSTLLFAKGETYLHLNSKPYICLNKYTQSAGSTEREQYCTKGLNKSVLLAPKIDLIRRVIFHSNDALSHITCILFDSLQAISVCV